MSKSKAIQYIQEGKHYYYNKNDSEKALEYYNKSILEDSSCAMAYVERGNVLTFLQEYEQALIEINKAILIDENYIFAYYVKVRVLIYQGKKDEAIELYDIINKSKQYHDMELYYHKGNTLQALGRTDEALIYYDKALLLNPWSAIVCNAKGNALQALGRTGEALVYYDKTLKLNPGSSVAYYNKGTALESLDWMSESIVYYDKALELDSRDISALYNKGTALHALGNINEAILCYDKIIMLNPQYVNAYSGKGNALRAIGNINQSIIYYDVAIEPNSKFIDAYNCKGNALQEMNMLDEALMCYDIAIKLNSNSPNAYLNKGKVLNINSRDQEALEYFEKAYKIIININLVSRLNINYVQKAFLKYIQKLLEKLIEIQLIVIEIRQIIEDFYYNNSAVEGLAEQFKLIKKNSIEITAKITDHLDSAKIKLEHTYHEQSLLEQITLVKKEMRIFIKNILVKLMDSQISNKSISNMYLMEEQIENSNIQIQEFINIRIMACDILSKIEIDNTIDFKDRLYMKNKIKYIIMNMYTLVDMDNIENIKKEINNLLIIDKITIDMVDNLEYSVNSLINKVTVSVVNNIIYNNPLLNNIHSFSEALKLFDFNKIIDLSEKLDLDLVDEAILNNDASLILAGLMSLEWCLPCETV